MSTTNKKEWQKEHFKTNKIIKRNHSLFTNKHTSHVTKAAGIKVFMIPKNESAVARTNRLVYPFRGKPTYMSSRVKGYTDICHPNLYGYRDTCVIWVIYISGFLNVSHSNGGLRIRISGWIGQLSCLTIFSTSLSVAAFLCRAGGSMLESTEVMAEV